MEQNLFSITEITDEAIKQYGLSEYEDDKSSIRKQVERELNNRKVFTNETKTQYQAKKPVKAYSEKIKNDVLNVWLKKYFLTHLTEDVRKRTEKEMKSKHGSKYYEDMSNRFEQENQEEMKEFSNLYANDQLAETRRKLLIDEFFKQKMKEVQDFAKSPYLLANGPDSSKLTKNSEIFRNKKREVMLDALFNEKFELDEDKLLADCQVLVEVKEDSDAQFSPEGLAFTDKFADNKNYYNRIEEE